MTPPDDLDDDAPKPLIGWLFWVMLGFGALCILGGIVVAYLIPRLVS